MIEDFVKLKHICSVQVRYLGEEGQNCKLAGAVAMCNPLDLVRATHSSPSLLQIPVALIYLPN